MFLDVVETKGKDLEDDLKEDLSPGLFFRFFFHNVVVLKIKQKCKMFLFGGTYFLAPRGTIFARANFKAGFLFCGLLGEPTRCKSLLAMGRYEYAAFAVLRKCTAMDSDPSATGHLVEKR